MIVHCSKCGAEIVYLARVSGQRVAVDAMTCSFAERDAAQPMLYNPRRHTSHKATCPAQTDKQRDDRQLARLRARQKEAAETYGKLF